MFALILPFASPITSNASALEAGQAATVITSYCYVYETPSLESDKLSKTEIDGSKTPILLKHNDIVTVESITGDFAKIQEYEGYVYKYYLTQNKSQDIYPVFNATVRNSSIIFDMDLNDSGFVATKDTRVYIYQGFDDTKEYTAVQVVLEDSSLYHGYILTENIKPDGVSSLLIVAITIIMAAVTIITSIWFIRKKSKKKEK